MRKLCYLDLETTGTDLRIHSIHQISGIIEIGGEVKETFDLKVQPHPKAQISSGALQVCGVDELDLLSYPPMGEVHKQFITMLGKYVDKFDKTDKFHLVGYNIQAFDNPFLRAWFKQNDDQWIGSWFWTDTLDVMILASQYLIDRRSRMPSFKLKRVALELGIPVDSSRLHDSSYDVEITKQIYEIVTQKL